MKNHERTHTGEKPLRHERSHTKEKPVVKPLACNHCDKRFGEQDNLRTHERIHTGKKHGRTHTGEKPYTCTNCKNRFRNRHNRAPSGGKPLCKTCRKGFKACHEKAHAGEEPSTCSECDKNFDKNADLKEHQCAQACETPITITCTKCDKSFNKKAYLNEHQCAHASETPFTCSKCDKKFDLEEHQCSHTGEKSFICSDEHERVHTGEKLSAGATCDKTFARTEEFEEHARVHTGEELFACAACDKTFARTEELEEHEKNEKVHTEEKPGKKECNFLNCNTLSWNIGRSVLKKIPEIKSVLDAEDIGICFLIECDENRRNLESIAPSQNLPNYSSHPSLTSNQEEKARITALVRRDMPFKVRVDLMNPGIQTIWIELVRKHARNILIGGVYREWSDDEDGDADKILSQFQRATGENLPVLIMGDMNLDT